MTSTTPPGLPADPPLGAVAEAPPPTKFRIAHGMLMVAAIAVGITVMRDIEAKMAGSQTQLSPPLEWFVHIAPLFASMSLALLVIRLRPPRPMLSQVFRQPGFTVGWITAFFLAIRLPIAALIYFEDSRRFFIIMHDRVSPVWPEIGGGVAVTWIALILSGAWRPEPSLIDRVGAALGLFWIGAFVAGSLDGFY